MKKKTPSAKNRAFENLVDAGLVKHAFSRRKMLGGMLGGAAATALLPTLGAGLGAGCGPSEKKRYSVTSVRKTIHVSFPSEIKAVLGNRAIKPRLALHIAGQTLAVVAHTRQSLANAKAHQLFDSASEEPTHYAESALFSAEGVQSYYLGYATDDGRVVPLLGGIHIPTQRDSQRSNLADGEEDPTHLSIDDAAIWAIYHDPGIMALDPAAASAVVAAARSCPEFDALRFEIKKRLVASTHDSLQRGEAWITCNYELDEKGQKIAMRNFDGTPLVGADGKQVYERTWVGAPAVVSATAALISATTTKLNSNPAFNNVKYINAPARAVGDDVTSLQASSLGEHKTRHFKCFDNNKTQSRRQVEVTIEGDELKASMTNHSALATMMVIESYSGTDHKVIGYGVAPSVFFPAIPFPPDKPYQTEAKLEVEVPENANEIRVWTTAGGFRRGVDASLITPAMERFYIATWAIDAVLDFVLPSMFIYMGIGGATCHSTLMTVVKHAAVHLLEEGAVEIVIEALASFVGQGKSLGDRFEEFGSALLGTFIKIMSRLLPEIFGSLAAGLIADVIVGAAVEKSIPVVGWTIAAIGVAQSLVQLGFATEHLITNQSYTAYRTIFTRDVKLTVKPKADEAQFPERAARYKATITGVAKDGTLLPIEKSGVFQSTADSFHVDFHEVPRLAFDINITLYDSDGAQVGLGHQRFPAPNDDEHVFEAEMETEGIPFNVTKRSRFTHARKLEVTANQRAWVGSVAAPAPAPTSDDRALSPDQRDGKVQKLVALTFSQTKQRLAYNFSSPNDTSAFSFHAHDIGRTTAEVNATAGTITKSRALIHSLRDHHCLIDFHQGTLAVFPYVVGETNLATFDPVSQASIGFHGRLHGTDLIHARIHPHAGVLCAVTNLGLEILPLSELSSQPGSSFALTRRGTQPGQLLTPIAVAPLRERHAVAVLEIGENRRIQLFDFNGNLLDEPTVSLAPTAADPFTGLMHTDLDVDSNGNYWVTGYHPTSHQFSMRVYQPSGQGLATASGVNAQRLALNLFNELYTLNVENVRGPGVGNYPEPTLSVWLPHES